MKKDPKKPASEQEVIELFARIFSEEEPPDDLLVGIGDDAAVVEPGTDPESKVVLTADMLVEDIDFTRSIHSPYDIGWRVAVANLSDIAAMGATPRWGICTLAVPEDITIEWLTDFGKGLKAPMEENGAMIIGGDLSRSPDRIVVSMSLVGETTGPILRRSGARLGDYIAVTGSLGGSSAGLALLKEGEAKVSEDVARKVKQAHLRPQPRIWAGTVIAGNPGIHTLMDISDGLGVDLGRLCSASRVGARLREEFIPVDESVLKVAEALERDPLEFINGGEDFELLFTGTREGIEYVATVLAGDPRQPPVTIIGEIIDWPFGLNLLRRDQTVVDPAKLGWDHFRKTGRSFI